MLDKTKTLLKNTGLFALGSFGAKFIYFFLVPLYTNYLTTQEYGTSELINTTVTLAFPFLTLSINDAILRYGIIEPERKHSILCDSVVILLASTALIIAMYPALAAIGLFGEWLGLFIVTLLTYQIRSVISVYLKAINKVEVFAIDSLVYAVAIGVFNCIALLLMNAGLFGYLIAGVFANTVSILFQIMASGIIKDLVPFDFDPDLLKEMLKYSIPLIFSAASWWIIQSSDRYMLNWMLDESAVGLYAVAAKMPAMLTSVTNVFSQAWTLSAIDEYSKDRDPDFFAGILQRYFALLSFVLIVALAIIKPFMGIYVGADYVGAWIYVPALLFAALLNAIAVFFTSLYKGAGNNIHEMILVLSSAVINVLANLFLIPLLGIQGACIGTLLSNLFMMVVAIIDTRKFFTFSLALGRSTLILLLVFVQMCAVLFDVLPYAVSALIFLIFFLTYKRELRHLVSMLNHRFLGKFYAKK